MYMEIEEVKKALPNTMNMQDYAATLQGNKPTVVLRDYNEPATPPCRGKGVQFFDFGTKPNVSGINGVNAIKAALGPGNNALHISDGSYTGYSIWELKEYLTNFDNTNLRVWIAEVFDCDDFSQVLQDNVSGFFPGIAFGTLWYGPKTPPYMAFRKYLLCLHGQQSLPC